MQPPTHPLQGARQRIDPENKKTTVIKTRWWWGGRANRLAIWKPYSLTSHAAGKSCFASATSRF